MQGLCQHDIQHLIFFAKKNKQKKKGVIVELYVFC